MGAWIWACKTLFRNVSHCSTEWRVGLGIGIEGGIEGMSEVSLSRSTIVCATNQDLFVMIVCART